MNIEIVCFGKMDNSDFESVLNFYVNKINKKAKLHITELKEEFNAEDKVNLRKNSETLEAKLQKFQRYQVIVLDVNSKEIDSIELAKLIEDNKDFKGGNILFVIGPSDGFTREFKSKHQRISFGKITLPHQLFRIVLCEQIYRALKINANEKYHK